MGFGLIEDRRLGVADMRKKHRPLRWLLVLITLCGLSSLLFSRWVREWNADVGAARVEGVTTAFFMRDRLASALFLDGVVAIAFGLFGSALIAGKVGTLNRKLALIPLLPATVFAIADTVCAAVGIPFLNEIYSVETGKLATNPIPVNTYLRIVKVLQLTTSATVLGAVVVFVTRLNKSRSKFGPTCPECGYSLRGLTRDNCPECGFEFKVES